MSARYGSDRRRGRRGEILSTLATLLVTLTFALLVLAVGIVLLRSALR